VQGQAAGDSITGTGTLVADVCMITVNFQITRF
jgi:hypothetical protein